MVPHIIKKDFHFFENHYSEQKGNQGLFKRKGRKAVKLDREEKEILEAYESGQLKLSQTL